MRVRQADDDPRLFAPDAPWSVWRGWIAFASLLPLLILFVVGSPIAAAAAVLWSRGGWQYVASVFSDRTPGVLPLLPTLGLIIVAAIGGSVACLIWQIIFFSSRFVDENAFKRYWDLTRPTRLTQALLTSILVGGAFVWLVLSILPA